MREKFRYLLTFAAHAPSLNHCCTSRFQVGDDGVDILAVDRLGSRFFCKHDSSVNAGAAADHLALAMRCYEMSSRTMFFPRPMEHDLQASVLYTGSCAPSAEDLALFNQIGVHRPIPDESLLPLESSCLDPLAVCVRTLGCRLAWLPSSDDPGPEKSLPRGGNLHSMAMWLILLTSADDPGSWLRAGQALSQVALRISQMGLRFTIVQESLSMAERRHSLAHAVAEVGYAQALLRIDYGPNHHEAHSARLEEITHEDKAWPPESAGEASLSRSNRTRPVHTVTR